MYFIILQLQIAHHYDTLCYLFVYLFQLSSSSLLLLQGKETIITIHIHLSIAILIFLIRGRGYFTKTLLFYLITVIPKIACFASWFTWLLLISIFHYQHTVYDKSRISMMNSFVLSETILYDLLYSLPGFNTIPLYEK